MSSLNRVRMVTGYVVVAKGIETVHLKAATHIDARGEPTYAICALEHQCCVHQSLLLLCQLQLRWLLAVERARLDSRHRVGMTSS